MYQRTIAPLLLESLKSYPVLTLLGPRQSGKTTLVRALFPDFEYKSLEDPDLRAMAKSDPRSLLFSSQKNIILDEVQRVPELTSYIQTIIDEPQNNQKFVLTGSNGLLLMDTIMQSLAGRTELFELFPLTIKELSQKNDNLDLNTCLFQGGYPRIYNSNLNPTKWFKNYFQLYVEKDIRAITNISQLDLFEKFVKLSAGRVGQLVNSSSLSNEVGVTGPTITKWINALKTTFVCFSLSPHFNNFNKRLVKSPKLYFYDVGLLCYLLGINSKEQLDIHPLRGNIFENFVISELVKQKANQGIQHSFYFWRDQKGHEIDLIDDNSSYLLPLEIKLSQTFNSTFLKNIQYLNQLQQDKLANIKPKGHLIYSGANEALYKDIKLSHWRNFLK